MTAQLTFDDEFNNLSLWNGSSGTWDTTFWYDDNNIGSSFRNSGLNDQETFINANYGPTSGVKPWTVNNGILTIQAAPASPQIASIIGAQYTSGQINTYHSFSQEYGYFEMRAQLPAGKGMWPAFWLMPKDGSWPPELDVMEVLGNDPTKLYTTVHTGPNNTMYDVNGGTTVADTSAGYHTYAVDWEADTIKFYFDGKEVFETATPSDMHKPFYILANLTVGGSWPGPVDSTTPFPANYNIDWIRAYSSNPYSATNPDSSNPGIVNGAAQSSPSASPPPPVSTTPTPTPTPPPPVAGSHTYNGTVYADTITGADNQHNTINGSYGNDYLVGGNLTNVINGNAGADTLVGGAGSDTLRGGSGSDVIHAGSGTEWISGDLGNNTIYGGAGTDTFHSSAGGHDYIYNWHNGDVVDVDPGVSYQITSDANNTYVSMSNHGTVELVGVKIQTLQWGWIVNG